jgi:hypothetical protein
MNNKSCIAISLLASFLLPYTPLVFANPQSDTGLISKPAKPDEANESMRKETKEQFVQHEISEWNKYYKKYYYKKYTSLDSKRLMASGLNTLKVCIGVGEQNFVVIFSLTLLNYKAMMLGLSNQYSGEAMDFVLHETQGSEYGLRWYQYQLDLISNPDKYGAPTVIIKLPQ